MGDQVFDAWVSFLSSFVVMPASAARVLALWCMHTWYAPKFPATCYVHVTSKGPGLGKSTLMEACAALSLNPKLRATLRMSVVREIEAAKMVCSYFWDQVESLSDATVNDEIALMLSGQRKGFKHGVLGVEYDCYCAKMFGCIGSIHPDLRTRCVVVELDFGVPSRVWADEVLTREAEAARLIGLFASLMKSRIGADAVPTWQAPEGFSGREREILTPLWTMAVALGLSDQKLAEVRQSFVDMMEFRKTVAQKSYRDLRADKATEQAREQEREYSVRALRDLASVLPHPKAGVTGNLSSVHVLEAMLALPEGPWRVFRGKALDAVTLAALVRPFFADRESATEMIREVPGRKGKLVRGYHRGHVLKALEAVNGES